MSNPSLRELHEANASDLDLLTAERTKKGAQSTWAPEFLTIQPLLSGVDGERRFSVDAGGAVRIPVAGAHLNDDALAQLS